MQTKDGKGIWVSDPIRGSYGSNATFNDTIMVFGKSRPIRNSGGHLIAPGIDQIGAFWAWFGDSVTVDDKGRPLVAYHGTTADIARFDLARGNSRLYPGGTLDTSFFTDNAENAAGYAGRRASMTGLSEAFQEGANVMPVYLKILSPIRIDGRGASWQDLKYKGELTTTADMAELAKQRSKDGLIVRRVVDCRDPGIREAASRSPSTTFAVFRSDQVKSAIGNTGAFHPTGGYLCDTRDEILAVRAKQLIQHELPFGVEFEKPRWSPDRMGPKHR